MLSHIKITTAKRRILNGTLFLVLVTLLFFGFLSKNQSTTTPDQNPLITNSLQKSDATVLQTKHINKASDTSQQLLELVITSGPHKNLTIAIAHETNAAVYGQTYEVGDRVIVTTSTEPDGSEQHFISGYNRRASLALLLLMFAGVTIFVSRQQGIRSLLSLTYSFFIIFFFMLPFIYRGHSPFLITIASAALIVPISFYFTHGLNKKTTIAILGTLVSLIVTGLLALLFIKTTHLTGFASEDAGLVSVIGPGMNGIDVQQLIIAGIIIGALGILDDVTVSQASITSELKETANSIPPLELYRKAMNVGKDHIASVINTLILVYTGAALPVLLILYDTNESAYDIANFEFIAEELVRMIVPSIGLIIAVPLTTLIAVVLLSRPRQKHD